MKTYPAPEPHAMHPRCWCKPAIMPHLDGLIIFHNDALGVALGLHPLRIEPSEARR